jgi:molybdopterin guanine dinucleotide-containing S/N-oxide reductase-like protein
LTLRLDFVLVLFGNFTIEKRFEEVAHMSNSSVTPAEPIDPEETLCTSCEVGGPLLVHVKNGRIIRVRPLPLTEADVKSARWQIQVGDRTFQPPGRTTVTPFGIGMRGRIYNPLRLKYPLKRVGFEPGGKGTVANRGKGEFTRIGWDEAIDITASEISRIQKKYGPEAVLPLIGGHSMWGFIHGGYNSRFFNIIGSSQVMGNPDSWEGWFWGGVHVWGFQNTMATPDNTNLLQDVMKNSQLLVFWSNDPETTWGYGGQDSLIWRLWLKELGVRQIHIDPSCNFTARRFADKWISYVPSTDSAIAASIAYVWFVEDTYDKEYVASHTYGFDKWKAYIAGEEDSIPKTPEWAEQISGVPAGVIKALAREWAAKRTTLCIRAGQGSANRIQGGTEWARMMILLQAMQGLGKPGVKIWDSQSGAPLNLDFKFPSYNPSPVDQFAKTHPVNPVSQVVYRLRVGEAITDPPVHWMGAGNNCMRLGADYQFKEYSYPQPGKSEIKMIYRLGGNYIGTRPDGIKLIKAYQSPKVEFLVGQTIWMEAETPFMDVVLPASTHFENSDISEWASAPFNVWRTNHRVIVYHRKCIEPLYESKPDMEIFTLLADKLGFKEQLTEGNTVEDWIRKTFEASDVTKYMTFEEFKKKGYFVVPVPEDHKTYTAFESFYKTGTGLDTPSGKIEFESQRILKFTPDDKERPPVPHYIPSWEGHTTVPLVNKYPLVLMSPHPRYSYHSHGELDPWTSDIWMHRVFKNGFRYWPVQIHPQDAAARNIQNGDIVKMFNDRAIVLLAAWITEKIIPGTVLARASAKYDPIDPGNPNSVDRGGSVNILISSRFMSTNVPGQIGQCLVQIEKWSE